LIVGWRLPWDRYFALEQITVEGGERIQTAELVRMTGLRPQLNLLFINTAQIRRQLLLSPWIQDARIQKIYPHRLRLSLVEREPYGILSIAGRGTLWVDAEGYVLSPLSQPPVGPVMSGVELISTPRGERVSDPGARAILQQFFSWDGQTLARLRELRWQGNWMTLISREGWQALLPARDLNTHFELLQRVLATPDAQRSLPRSIDLRFDGEVTLGR
jgi:hypothetical protein